MCGKKTRGAVYLSIMGVILVSAKVRIEVNPFVKEDLNFS
jgi:hypothetical protein